MATTLDDVGLQVWNGALLLSDYLLSQPDIVRDRTILELGAGTGLVSLVAAECGARRVYVTDVGDDVLENCHANVTANLHANMAGRVHVRDLNWTDAKPIFEASVTAFRSAVSLPTPFSLTPSDARDLRLALDVVLAADGKGAQPCGRMLVERWRDGGYLNTHACVRVCVPVCENGCSCVTPRNTIISCFLALIVLSVVIAQWYTWTSGRTPLSRPLMSCSQPGPGSSSSSRSRSGA